MKLIWSLIGLAALVYLVGFTYIVSHEQIHHQIYARYNIRSKISIHPFSLSGVVEPYIPMEVREKCNDACKSSHALNDVIGYYTKVFIFNTWALLLAYMLLKKYQNGKQKTRTRN